MARGKPILVNGRSPFAGHSGSPLRVSSSERPLATPLSVTQWRSSVWFFSASRVFLVGFGLSLLLLIAEYLTGGRFPGWFVLVPSNPTTLLGALVGHQAEAAVGPGWADEAFFSTLVVESALWWYAVGVLVEAVRRRRARL